MLNYDRIQRATVERLRRFDAAATEKTVQRELREVEYRATVFTGKDVRSARNRLGSKSAGPDNAMANRS